MIWPTRATKNCERSMLRARQRSARVKMARINLLEFTKYTKPDYRVNWHHKLLAERLDRVAAGLCPRLMIFLPPQHGKSELVSRRFPAFVLGRNPELRLIGSSHTNDLATSMNRDVQRIICDNAYRNLFPDCRLSDRSVRTGSRVEARRTFNLFKDKLLYVDAILDHIVLDQLVRKTLLFCEQKKPDFVGIEAEQFQELLVHEFVRQCGEEYALRWSIWKMLSRGFSKIARIRRLSQYVLNRELRFKADSPGCRLLVDQLMDFPLGDHDGPDALEMCIRLPLEMEQG